VKWIHCIPLDTEKCQDQKSFKNFLNQTTGCGDIAFCLAGYFILSHPVYSGLKFQEQSGQMPYKMEYCMMSTSLPVDWKSNAIKKVHLQHWNDGIISIHQLQWLLPHPFL